MKKKKWNKPKCELSKKRLNRLKLSRRSAKQVPRTSTSKRSVRNS